MSEEAAQPDPKKSKPTYIMVSRKLINTWLVTNVVMLFLIIASFQYTNYVDRRSNQSWCGIVDLFNSTYKESPPPLDTGKIFAREFLKLRDNFRCK